MRPWLVRTILAAVVGTVSAAGAAPLPQPAGDALRIWFIDVDGGQSTLFVTPEGHSLLVDTGWESKDGLDATRIVAAMKQAKITKVDAVLITHFHADHVGGVVALASRVKIGILLDHGPNRELNDPSPVHGYAEYQKLLEAKGIQHRTMLPGDMLPVKGLEATVVSADGKLLAKPLADGGQTNKFCDDAGQKAPDETENSRSLGFALQWGNAIVVDLGDLTRDKEKELMCPVNKLGHVDLLVVSHHGWYQSSSRALVDAITPRVAIMDNGEKKGGSVPVLDTFRQSPSHPALWQLHYSAEGGTVHNTDASRIANPLGADGAMLRATVSRNGSISVWNSRTGQTVQYQKQ